MQRDYNRGNKSKSRTDWRSVFLLGLVFLFLVAIGYLIYAVEKRKPFISTVITRFDQFKNWHLFSQPMPKPSAVKEAIIAQPVEFEFYDTLANKKALAANSDENNERKMADARALQAKLNADLPTYFLQLGVYQSLGRAQHSVVELDKQGFKSVIMSDKLANKIIYRVELGPLYSHQQVNHLQQELKIHGMSGIVRISTAGYQHGIAKEKL